jgi:hypothetical protein
MTVAMTVMLIASTAMVFLYPPLAMRRYRRLRPLLPHAKRIVLFDAIWLESLLFVFIYVSARYFVTVPLDVVTVASVIGCVIVLVSSYFGARSSALYHSDLISLRERIWRQIRQQWK